MYTYVDLCNLHYIQFHIALYMYYCCLFISSLNMSLGVVPCDARHALPLSHLLSTECDSEPMPVFIFYHPMNQHCIDKAFLINVCFIIIYHYNSGLFAFMLYL